MKLSESDQKLYQLHIDLSAQLAREIIGKTIMAGGNKAHVLVTLSSLVCLTLGATYYGDPEGSAEHMMDLMFDMCRERMKSMEEEVADLHESMTKGGHA